MTSASKLIRPETTALVVIDLQERLVPAIDGEIGFPFLVFMLWGAVAVFVVHRFGLGDPEPPS